MLKIRFVSLLSIALMSTSCSVTPPDVPLCTELTPSKGYCINTMSSREFEVNEEKKFNGKTWWQVRPYMIYMPIDSWVKLKSFIIKVCRKTKACSGRNITSWERTVKRIDQKIVKP